MSKKKYYAVASGRKIGIYSEWFGADEAKNQVVGFNGAKYKKFYTREEAESFISNTVNKKYYRDSYPKDNTIIYTDGCSLGNPGPGGYGVVIIQNELKEELSGGCRHTTNNRMELTACIIGLNQLKRLEQKRTSIILYSDSKYLINGISEGWANKWKKNSWTRSNGKKIKNIDLWEKLLHSCSNSKIKFKWVKGHSGNPNNEKCDKLANLAARNVST